MNNTVSQSSLFRVTSVLLQIPLQIVALYLLLRGHNLPGGGFIAGLVSALGFLLYGLAHDLAWLEEKMKIDFIQVALAGLGLALISGALPLIFSHPFLTHFQGYWDIPYWGKVYWGTPLLFDIGVMLLVIGICVKIITLLACSGSGHHPFPAEKRHRYAARVEEWIEEPHQEKGDGHGH